MIRRINAVFCILLLSLFAAAAVLPRCAEAATSVRVTSPNGGEVWNAGGTYNITWTSTDADGYQVFIEYAEELGSTWHKISGDSGLSNTGSWGWTIPLSYSTNHGRIRVKLVRFSNVYSDISDNDFTIIQTPARPVNLDSTAATSSSIKLEWDDMSGNETGFKVERKTGSGSFVQVKTVGANVTTCWDTGLTPGASYQYRVRAYNSHGNSDYSNITTAETIVFMLAAPQAPSELQATVVTGSEIDLHWTDNSGGETGFKIERKTGSGAFTQVATVGANVTIYYDTGLAAGAYSYRVRAYNATGDSDYSNEDNAIIFTLVFPITSYPAAPTELAAAAADGTRVDLTWTDNSNNEDGFKIERKTGSGAFTQVATSEADTTAYTDTGLAPDTTYRYRVRAYNSLGNSDYSNEANATTPDSETLPPGTAGKTVLRFYIDSGEYYVKGSADSAARLRTMDTAPIISGSRTLLPIRYVAEPLGAEVGWDAALDQVTVQLGSQTIVMWINNGTARINDVETAIDPSNPAVTPIIVPPGRTMLPLRFIAENLGCQVEWNPELREVTVIYPKD